MRPAAAQPFLLWQSTAHGLMHFRLCGLAGLRQIASYQVANATPRAS